MINIHPLEEEKGQFIHSIFGATYAFLFRGDENFLERSYNLVNNFSSVEKKFHQFDENTFYFTLTEEEAIDIIALYYRGQLVMEHHPENEELEKLAKEKAILFWETKVEKYSMFKSLAESTPDPYLLGYIKSINRLYK